ncbi:MAG: hypothetical protein SCK70_15440, partial [bacterium]|nr:hypothetical protein [bacterium]
MRNEFNFITWLIISLTVAVLKIASTADLFASAGINRIQFPDSTIISESLEDTNRVAVADQSADSAIVKKSDSGLDTTLIY